MNLLFLFAIFQSSAPQRQTQCTHTSVMKCHVSCEPATSQCFETMENWGQLSVRSLKRIVFATCPIYIYIYIYSFIADCACIVGYKSPDTILSKAVFNHFRQFIDTLLPLALIEANIWLRELFTASQSAITLFLPTLCSLSLSLSLSSIGAIASWSWGRWIELTASCRGSVQLQYRYNIVSRVCHRRKVTDQ